MKTAQPDMDAAKMKILGFDSIYAERHSKKSGGVYHDEYVVYNPKQALPKYIIKFDRITDPTALTLAFSTTEYTEREILKSRNFTSSEDDIYFRIAEAQFLRMIEPHKAEVTKVILIQNPTAIEKFKKKQQELSNKNGEESKRVLAFHGTEESNIPEICRKNFLLEKVGSRTGSVYGAGIYFSEKSITSHGYARGTSTTHKLLLCQVLLGKDYAVARHSGGLNNAPLQPGYDCHNVEDGLVIVIYHPDQILPFFVVEYTLKL